MTEVELTEEDYKNIALRIKINNLSRIATLIPTKYNLVKLISTLGTIKRKPDVVEYERHNLSRYLRFDEEINDVIKMFIEKLEEYENLVNLNTLHKNLKSVKINEKELGFIDQIRKKLGLSTAAAIYNSSENKIKLFHGDSYDGFSKTLTHELLHLASSTKQGVMIYNGFKQYNPIIEVEKGRAINEGATEFINKVLFGYTDNEMSYTELVNLVKWIADLIGFEKLFQLYFNNDLKGLLYEISKYSDKTTASSIITAMDRLYELKYDRLARNPAFIAKDLEESLLSLMVNLNIKKQQDLLNKNEITNEEYDKNIRDIYMHSIGCTVEESINLVNNKKTYTITCETEKIKVTEKEYKRFIEECKSMLTDLTDQEKIYECIVIIMHQMRRERKENGFDAYSEYRSVQGFYDVQGNSLDTIKFSYENLLENLFKAIENGNSIIEINDDKGVLYQIDFESALIMREKFIFNIDDYYINNFDVEVGEKLIKSEDIVDDYNNSEKDDLHSGCNKKYN